MFLGYAFQIPSSSFSWYWLLRFPGIFLCGYWWKEATHFLFDFLFFANCRRKKQDFAEILILIMMEICVLCFKLMYLTPSMIRIWIHPVKMQGMGEPLNNYAAVVEAIQIMTKVPFQLSPKKITVSTVGTLDQCYFQDGYIFLSGIMHINSYILCFHLVFTVSVFIISTANQLRFNIIPLTL